MDQNFIRKEGDDIMPDPITLLPVTYGYISPMVFDNLPSQMEQIAALNAKVNELVAAINLLNA